MTLPRVSCAVFLTLVLIAGVACAPGGDGGGRVTDRGDSRERHLLIVLDGLRPDYVTPDLMPNLHGLGKRGVVFTRHHAIYPTVTRVNAASISTGSYPETHGLLGNSVFFPAVDATRFLNTADRENLLAIERAVDNPLLTATTLGEQLERNGRSLLVVSAGSSGSSYLLHHTAVGGGIIHADYGLPVSLHEEVVRTLGEAPQSGTPNDARNRYVVDAFFEAGLPLIDPTVTVMWLADPDGTAHAHGIGHPITNDSLRRLDSEIGNIQDRLRSLDLLDHINIWVTSDHGFSTHTGAVDVDAVVAAFQGVLDDGSPRIVAGGGAIYVRDHDPETVAAIVAALQSSPRVGAVFTRGATRGALEGVAVGTLSFDVVHWDHPRAAEILYSANWTDDENEHGYRGTSAQDGTAGHGSTSPFDIHNVLLAAGPGLKSGVTIDVPSANLDFAPTFLSRYGIDIPDTMQGRVLAEAFVNGPDPAVMVVESAEHTVENVTGSYRLTAFSTIVDGRRYLDYAQVTRRIDGE